MILKKLKIFGMIAIVASVTILACKDDFTEEDFLKLQDELAKDKEKRDSAYLEALTQEQAESYIAALNEAGDLMSVTVLVREDNTPVAGVSVSMTSGASPAEAGRTKDVVTVVTDAQGRAVFERATIGDNLISLSKANYVSASARVDFGEPSEPQAISTFVNNVQVTRYIAPPKRFENFALPLYSESASEGNTAVIQGTFSIQNDLTNDPNAMDPIPAGLVVSADLSTALITEGDITSSCNCVLDYRFSGVAGSLGVAAINPASGAFSMRVPATADGMSIGMIYPTVAGTQRIAIRRLNGVDLPTPEFRQVPVRWEPGVNATATVPVIPGARAVFSYNGSAVPAPAGSGFTINNFTPVARPMEIGTISGTGNTTIGNTTYRINSRGSGYTSTPTVTISNGGGQGATATAVIRTQVPALSITAGGSGYTAGILYDIQFFYATVSGVEFLINTIQDVQATPEGTLPIGDLVLPAGDGFSTAFILPSNFNQLGFRVVNNGGGALAGGITQPTFNIVPPTELANINITNDGYGYTSAPTITLNGGGVTTNQASVTVVAFKTQFDFSLPLDIATVPYRVLPANIRFTYPPIIIQNQVVESQVVESQGLVDMINPSGIADESAVNILDRVTTNGTNIIPRNNVRSFRTDRAWTTPPIVSVENRVIQAAAANLNIDAVTGEISFINPVGDINAGSTALIPLASNTVTGQGYDGISVEIVPTISGAPGSGAVVSLATTQDVNTRVVTWTTPGPTPIPGATTILSPGSGYLANLNRTTAGQNYSGAVTPITVQTGKVYNLTINAGTGVRLENIDN